MPREQHYRRTHDVDLQRIVRSIAAEAHLWQAGKEYVPHGLNRCLYLSYAPEDSGIVRAFAKELERCGVDVWLDEDRIGEKPDYDALIAKALIFSGGFAPFLTDAFFACNLAQFEYKLIVGMIKQLKNKYYAPIVPYDDLPPGLNRSGLITLYDAPLLGAARIVAAQMARFLTRILAPAASREANYLASEFLRVTGHPQGVPAPVRFIGLPEDMRVFLSAAHLDVFKKHGMVPTGITTYERKGTLSLSTEDPAKEVTGRVILRHVCYYAARANFSQKLMRRLLQGPPAEPAAAFARGTASRRLQLAPAGFTVSRGKPARRSAASHLNASHSLARIR